MQDLPGYGIRGHPDKFGHYITIADYETSRTVSFPGWTNDLVIGLSLKSLQYSYREVPRTYIHFPGQSEPPLSALRHQNPFLWTTSFPIHLPGDNTPVQLQGDWRPGTRPGGCLF